MHTHADGFHQGMHIHQTCLARVFLQMLPATGFEEQAGAQVAQGLGQVLVRFVQGNTLSGNFAAFLYRPTVFVAVEGMGERDDILPGRVAGGEVTVNQLRIGYFIHCLPFQQSQDDRQ